MKFLRKMLDAATPKFEKGGPFEKLYPIFEATDTILFSTNERNESGPHIRDSVDNKRITMVWN